MTKPVFGNDQSGRQTEGKETMSSAIVSAGVKEVPQSSVSGKGEGKPSLASFALAKILICLKHSNLVRQ